MTSHIFPDVLPDGALDGAGDDDMPDIIFTPVERQRRRRNGWSADRQRAFIATLSRCGSVAAAARSVGDFAQCLSLVRRARRRRASRAHA